MSRLILFVKVNGSDSKEKKGVFKGDLGKVVRLRDQNTRAVVKLIPLIDKAVLESKSRNIEESIASSTLLKLDPRLVYRKSKNKIDQLKPCSIELKFKI